MAATSDLASSDVTVGQTTIVDLLVGTGRGRGGTAARTTPRPLRTSTTPPASRCSGPMTAVSAGTLALLMEGPPPATRTSALWGRGDLADIDEAPQCGGRRFGLGSRVGSVDPRADFVRQNPLRLTCLRVLGRHRLQALNLLALQEGEDLEEAHDVGVGDLKAAQGGGSPRAGRSGSTPRCSALTPSTSSGCRSTTSTWCGRRPPPSALPTLVPSALVMSGLVMTWTDTPSRRHQVR